MEPIEQAEERGMQGDERRNENQGDGERVGQAPLPDIDHRGYDEKCQERPFGATQEDRSHEDRGRAEHGFDEENKRIHADPPPLSAAPETGSRDSLANRGRRCHATRRFRTSISQRWYHSKTTKDAMSSWVLPG